MQSQPWRWPWFSSHRLSCAVVLCFHAGVVAGDASPRRGSRHLGPPLHETAEQAPKLVEAGTKLGSTRAKAWNYTLAGPTMHSLPRWATAAAPGNKVTCFQLMLGSWRCPTRSCFLYCFGVVSCTCLGPGDRCGGYGRGAADVLRAATLPWHRRRLVVLLRRVANHVTAGFEMKRILLM